MLALIRKDKKSKGSDVQGVRFGVQDDRVFLVVVALLICCIIFINNHVQSQNEKRLELPGVALEKPIDFFDLIGEDGVMIGKTTLQGSRISIVFIFSQPCPVCEHNIFFWNKLMVSVCKGYPAFGIVLSDSSIEEIANSLEYKKLRFKIFVPADREKFFDSFNVQFNLAQTVLVQDGKVIYRKSGDITPDDYFKIKNIIKGGFK